MDLIKGEYQISIDSTECYDLAMAINHRLEHSIENHYNNLQQDQDGEALFYEREQRYLDLMKEFLEMVGRRDFFDSLDDDFKRMFEERRTQREHKSRSDCMAVQKPKRLFRKIRKNGE